VRPDGAFAQLVRGVDTTHNMRHDLHPAGPESADERRAAFEAKVRKTLSWPRSWANFSLCGLYFYRNA
jgi:hypothetical protein